MRSGKRRGRFGKGKAKALTFTVLFVTLAFSLGIGCASAVTICVPDDYVKIQWAIDNASVGDTIFVRNGTYYENINLKDGVRVQGKSADVTTIDGGGTGSVVMGIGVGPGSVLDGFTITNGSPEYWGGGIYIRLVAE